MKRMLIAAAAAAIVLASCVTGYTPEQKAEARKSILQVVTVAWKSGGKVLAQAELEKYIKEHELDEAQAEFVRATAAGIVEAIEQQAAEAAK